MDRTRAMIEGAGLRHAPPAVVPNTLAALQLGEHAREEGRFHEVHRRLFEAYWAEGRDIGDHEVLAEVAEASGLDGGDARSAVREGRYAERVRSSTDAALELGVNGVPAWLVDERILVPGAQPHEIFEGVLSRLGHPPVDGGTRRAAG